jgi:[protein-PII] uridylyltransferase
LVKHRKLGNNLYKSDFESIINKINKGILSPTSNIKLSKKIKKPFQMVTKINFSEDKNLMKTLLCIETLDQPKLLVKIAKSFLDLNIDVHSARITTLGERVEDNFQLLDSKNGKFLTKNKKNDLTKSLNNL